MMPRRAIRLLASLALVLALSLTVAACGKRGNPAPPEGTTDTFPKKYPVR